MVIKQSEVEVNTEVFETHDGLCAWRRNYLPDVALDMTRQGHAILGGEVWVVEGNLFSALSPRREGGWAVFSWEAAPRHVGEPWEHFVTRTLREALDTVCSLDPEANVAPEVGDKLYYHLRFADELGYYRLQKASSDAVVQPESKSRPT